MADCELSRKGGRDANGGADQRASGLWDGSGASGVRRWPPQRYSRMVGPTVPFCRPGDTGRVLWKTPSA